MQQSRRGQFVLFDFSVDNVVKGALADAILRIDVPSPNLSVRESDTTPLIVDSLYLQDTLNYCCPVNLQTAQESFPKPFRIGLRAFFFKKQAPLIK